MGIGGLMVKFFINKLLYNEVGNVFDTLGPNEYIHIPKGLHRLLDKLTDPNIDQNERPSESDIIKTLNDNMKNQWYRSKPLNPAGKRSKSPYK
jgi:hypothetical protein